MSNAVSAAASGTSRGSIEERLRAELGSPTASITVAQRSPVGAGAFRIGWLGSPNPANETERLVAQLRKRAWAEQVALRPPNIYVRVSTGTLRDWVVESFHAPSLVEPGSERKTLRVSVQRPDRWAESDLNAARAVSVAHSLAALLESRGFEVETELRTSTAESSANAAARLSIDGLPEHRELHVGGVEVGYGALRAKYGGALCDEDVLQDLTLRGRWQSLASAHDVQGWSKAALAFVLLRSEVARHVRLNDASLGADVDDFNLVYAAVVERPTLRAESAAAEVTEDTVRGLALLLDGLGQASLRGALELEPALVTRQLRALARQATVATQTLASDDALWGALRRGMARALELLGVAPLSANKNRR